MLNSPLIDGLVTSGSNKGFSILLYFIDNGSQTFWQKVTTASGSTNMWQVQSNNTDIEFTMNSTNGGRFTVIGSNPPTDHNGVMHCYVLTYNGANWITLSNFQWYADGVPMTMTSSQNNPITLNTDSGGDFKLVGGTHSHMMIWNRVLSAGEIRDLAVQPFAFMAPVNSDWFGVGGAAARIRHQARIY